MALVLALECSSVPCSAALLADGRTAALQVWEPAGFRNQGLFTVLPALFREAGLAAADVDLFAAGTGPGAFTALRMACAAIAGLALPGNRLVLGIPSCEAAALQLLEQGCAAPVSLLGDARRGRYWHAQYGVEGGWPIPLQPPSLFDEGGLTSALRGAATIASPDWPRVAAACAVARPDGAHSIEHSHVPGAAAVARLAAERVRRGQALAPAVPIYLTAATLAAPRAAPATDA